MNIIKKLWNGILTAIAWVTRDSPRLNREKHKINPEGEAFVQRLRSQIWK